MELAIVFGLIILIVAAFRPLRARIAASDAAGVQRFRQWHKPMERMGAACLLISAVSVLFWGEAGVYVTIGMLGAVIFYFSLLTRPDP